MTAIAAIANSAGDQFVKHYDVLMPNLLHILDHYKAKEQRKLRGKAIECVSLVGKIHTTLYAFVLTLFLASAVGKEKCPGQEIVKRLIEEQGT